MSSLVSFISGFVYSPVAQLSEVQNIAAGVMCIRQATKWLWDTDPNSAPSPEPSRVRKYAVKAAGALFLTIGIAGLVYPFLQSSNHTARLPIASYEDQFY